jgi:hypothetical protein
MYVAPSASGQGLPPSIPYISLIETDSVFGTYVNYTINEYCYPSFLALIGASLVVGPGVETLN